MNIFIMGVVEFVCGAIAAGCIVGVCLSKKHKKERIYIYNAGWDRGFADGTRFMQNIDEFNEDGE